MKKTLYYFFIFCIIVTAFSGCKNRQVTPIVDPTDITSEQNSDTTKNTSEHIGSNASVQTTTDSTPSLNEVTSPPAVSTGASQTQVTSEAISTVSPSATNTQPTSETPATTDSDSSTQTPSPDTAPPVSTNIIVAESENLDDVDERAILLNELDAMLSNVLTTLDDMEENPITEDVTNLGGK